MSVILTHHATRLQPIFHFFPDSAGTLKSLALTRAMQVDSGKDHRQLRGPQFDAGGFCGAGHFEAANFEPLEPGITVPSFLSRYRITAQPIWPGFLPKSSLTRA